MSVVHLHPIDAGRPAFKRYPEAQFELLIAALDPACCPPDPGDPELRVLHPLDDVEQFHGVSDRDAVRILESCVRAVCDGRMSPDEDFRSAWREVLAGTVAHFAAGKHVES